MASRLDGNHDPGWGEALRRIGWGLLPIPGLSTLRRRRLARDPDVTALTMLRTIFASFAWSLVLIGVVTLVMAGTLDESVSPAPVLGAVGVVGVLSLLGTHRVAARLDGNSQPALATTYRARFFLRIALAEAAALVGFVGFMLTAQPYVYFVGTAFAAAGFVTAAPSARNLARDQHDLRAAGSAVALKPLLLDMRPATD